MSIAHYNIGESCSHAWLAEMISMETEGQLVPELVQSNFSRVVSRDALQGCAPLESEVAA